MLGTWVRVAGTKCVAQLRALHLRAAAEYKVSLHSAQEGLWQQEAWGKTAEVAPTALGAGLLAFAVRPGVHGAGRPSEAAASWQGKTQVAVWRTCKARKCVMSRATRCWPQPAAPASRHPHFAPAAEQPQSWAGEGGSTAPNHNSVPARRLGAMALHLNWRHLNWI